MHQCIHPSSHHSIIPYMHLSIAHAYRGAASHPSIIPSVHHSIRPSMHPSIHPSFHPSIIPCMHLSIAHPYRGAASHVQTLACIFTSCYGCYPESIRWFFKSHSVPTTAITHELNLIES